MSSSKIKLQTQISLEVGKPVKISSDIPDKKDLIELLNAFRHFYGNKEPANFLRIRNIIAKYSTSVSNDRRIIEKLNAYKNRWKSALFEGMIMIEWNGEKLIADNIIDLWYNAEYFHSDQEKEKELNKLNELLSSNFSKQMFADVLLTLSRIVLEFYDSIKTLTRPEDYDAVKNLSDKPKAEFY